MKTLYESILDNDFDDDIRITATASIESLLYSSSPHTKIKVHFEDDKFVIDFKGPLVCSSDETEELLKILEVCNVKKLIFNSPHTDRVGLYFRHNIEVSGYDITANTLAIVILDARVTFKSCVFRIADNLELRGHSSYPSERIIFGEKTIVYAEGCSIDSVNVSIKKTAQFNLQYEIYINNPTKAQRQWMKKSSIPMSYSDIQNQMSPDMWTNPLYGLLKSKETITDHVVIRGDNLDFTYNFFLGHPDHLTREIAGFDLTSGWTLNIDYK